MCKRKLISVISIVLIPFVIAGGYFYLEYKQYYIVSAVVLILSMIPFFISLENRKLHARELVTIASMVAIAVASRAAFYAIPQVKPMCAIVIITAITFGAQIGFVTGALSMLLSNFIFGQGMWTPFQMFGMGLTALICGLLFYRKKAGDNILIVALTGGVICFAVYGVIVDTSSVLMMSSDFSLGSVLSIYASGLPFNAIHGATTFVVLLIAGKVIKEILERIMIKYDLFGGSAE
jgi:uncharacterized membrane protein